MPLTTSEKIKIIMTRKGITAAAVAAALNCSVQNVYKKLRRDKWSAEELNAWAAILESTAETVFTDTATGERI